MKSEPVVGRTKTSTPQQVVDFDTPLGQLILYKGDGTQPLGVIYDRIIVTAGGDKIPLTFIKDLNDGGILVMPIQAVDTRQFLVTIMKLKSDSTPRTSIRSIGALNSYLNGMVSRDIEHSIVNFKMRYSLSITLDIPVRFVPLKYT